MYTPTYWRPFDDSVPNAARVRQVLQWLALPAAERPSLITLYFSEVDHAGHRHGPDSPRVLEAASRLDAALGQLLSGIQKLNLLDRTTLVIVSDHGMSQVATNRVIFLDDYLQLSTVDVIEWSPNLGLLPRSTTVDDIYRALKDKHPALAVYSVKTFRRISTTAGATVFRQSSGLQTRDGRLPRVRGTC